jgi:hypothetical protein
MKWIVSLALTLIVAAGSLAPARATVQESQSCWEPDIEYPVPCDDDDD